MRTVDENGFLVDEEDEDYSDREYYIDKDRCTYCREMFDGFCAKAKKDVKWNEMFSVPYKPEWCPGRTPSNEYHD